MDLGTIGPILIGALGALAAIGQYLRRQARADRAENRKLRRMVLAYDGHTFALERDIARTGRAPRPRPSILMEAEHDDDEDARVPEAAGPEDDEHGAAGRDAGARPEARSGRRHRAED